MSNEINWGEKVAYTVGFKHVESAIHKWSEQVYNTLAKGEAVKSRKRILSFQIKKLCEEAGIDL